MLTIDSIVLYVEDIQASKKFYTKLFSCEAKELSPTFASLDLKKLNARTQTAYRNIATISNYRRWHRDFHSRVK